MSTTFQYMGIDFGRLQGRMAKLLLNRPDIDAVFQGMGGEGMP